MRRRVEGKVSHFGDFCRAAVSSAVYAHFPDRETWLPYGYVAEISAAYVCASLGITPTVRHADYIGSWLEVLREDNRAIVRAASQASKAADYLYTFERGVAVTSPVSSTPAERLSEINVCSGAPSSAMISQ
jgi:antirestriction protein ArdC